MDPNDPTGYDYLAKLHNVSRQHPDGTIGACEHYSEEFFPWHRAHLAIFERLLREINPTVALPYWDWSNAPSGARLPVAFERMNSPLFHAGRYPAPVPPVLWDADEIIKFVQEPVWTLFAGEPKSTGGSYGNIEDGPHNDLHPLIGPTMGTPFTAAEDPVYWSFHAYIDLIWSRWQRRHNTSYECPDCKLWLEPDQFTVENMTETTNYGYEYDYDFSIDDPVLAASTFFPSGSITMKKESVGARALRASPESGTNVGTAEPGTSMPRKLLKLSGIQVYQDLTYRLLIYVHPDDISIEALSEADREPYLVTTKTVWRSHMGVNSSDTDAGVSRENRRPSLYIDVSNALNAYSDNEWTVTVLAESAPNILAGTEAYQSQKASEDNKIEALQNIIETMEIVDR